MRFTLFLFLTFIITAIQAQNNSFSPHSNNVSNSISFTGNIRGPFQITDTISVIFRRDYLSHLEGAEILRVHPKYDGSFEFGFSNVDHPATMLLGYYIDGHYYDLGDYFVEPGDKIHILLNGNKNEYHLSPSFEGEGVAKYNCRLEIDKIKGQFDELRKSTPIRKLDDLDGYRKLIDSGQVMINSALIKYKNILSASMYNLMAAEFSTYVPTIWLMEIGHYYRHRAKSETEKQKVIKFYKKPLSVLPLHNSNISALSKNYVLYLQSKFTLDLFIANNGKGYEYKKLYSVLKKNTNGLLREKLLMLFFLSIALDTRDLVNYKPSDFDECLRDALKYIKTPYIQEALNNSFSVYKRGTEAFPFSFVNTQGGTVNLKDLKGKTILLDVWFTNCLGCLDLGKKLHEDIYPEFKKDSSFVILSISTDEKKETWLKSLNSGKYSQPEFINVYTGGVGFYEHPLIKHYNIQGAPWSIIIDKNGRVFCKISYVDKSDNIKKWIKEALGQN